MSAKTLSTFQNEHELADDLGVSVRTVQRWRCEGGGPPFHKLKGACRYRRSDVEKWLETTRRSSTSDLGLAVNDAGVRVGASVVLTV